MSLRYTAGLQSSKVNPESPVTSIEYFIVGGGGGGAGNQAGRGFGGAGGGSILSATEYTVVPGITYTITVGAGAPGGVDIGGIASPESLGGFSIFSPPSGPTSYTANTSGVISAWGGKSSTSGNRAGGGNTQGSDGGLGFAYFPYYYGYDGLSPTGVDGYTPGYSGGGSIDNNGGGGGGGSGGPGMHSEDTGGIGIAQGGPGIVSTFSGISVQYGGGGGGGGSGGIEPSRGKAHSYGASGGGEGGRATYRFEHAYGMGMPNTGGGAGGTSSGGIAPYAPAYNHGNQGGSGIVMIRYPAYMSTAKSTTGMPQTYIAGYWRVYKFISSGSITF